MRGKLVIERSDTTSQILGVTFEEAGKNVPEVEMKAICETGGMYTLEVPSLSLMTSMSACHYANVIGLNDTLAFSTDVDAKKLTAMSVETRDLKYLATFERNPKKKRLMQERQFEQFAG